MDYLASGGCSASMVHKAKGEERKRDYSDIYLLPSQNPLGLPMLQHPFLASLLCFLCIASCFD